MQRVNAHTSVVGDSTLTGNSSAQYRNLTASKPVWVPLDGRTTNARSFKSTTVDGAKSGEFRLATKYVRLIAKHESLTSGTFFKRRSPTSGGYTWEYQFSDARKWISPKFSGMPYVDWLTGSVNVGNIANRAWAECRNKVADTKIDVGVALGESLQTINMISSRIVSLVQFVSAVRQRKWKRAYDSLFGRNAPKPRSKYRKPKWARGNTPKGRKPSRTNGPSKDAANAWLEYWYGWFPLVMDVYGLCEQLREGFREHDQLYRVERTVTEALNPRDFFTSDPDVEASGSYSASAKATIWFKVVSSLNALAQLGLNNPASIAWELTTLSFVIDWLIPVGNWLQSLTALAGTSIVDCHCVHAVHGSGVAWHNNPGTGINHFGVKPNTRLSVMCMHRYVYTTAPIPLPYYRNPLSTTHLVTALALLRQRR